MGNPLDKVTEKMPDPQPHAIAGAEAEATAAAQAPAQGQQSPASAPGLKDRQGRAFDPDLHEVGADKQPVTNKDGTLRLKRGRGAEKAQSAPNQSSIKTPEMARIEPTATKTGHLIAEQIFAVGRMIGGEEWQPLSIPEQGLDERSQMRDAWASYCEFKDIRDIPPGIALGMVMLAYVSPRLFMPKTKSRIQKAKEWAITTAVKLKLWKGRRFDTRSNRGDDGKRENDDSKEAS